MLLATITKTTAVGELWYARHGCNSLLLDIGQWKTDTALICRLTESTTMVITSRLTADGPHPKLKQIIGEVLSAAMSNVGLPAEVVDAMYDRAVSHPSRGNLRNISARPESKTGLKGAHSDGRGKFSARIMINGKRKTLGHFCTPEEAHEEYIKACNLHGLLP